MRMRLRFEIALTLVVKAAALTALYLLFFAPAHRPEVSAAAVAQHLYAAPHQGALR
ncbi:MAG: phosphoglycerate mutase [Alphaproteobacteria bacterium]|nr:phosphoglycerate mutase [Alphaproteobacteria bacterium]